MIGGGIALVSLLAHREGVTHDTGGVLDRLLGLDRAVGDDLGDPLLAVLLGDVADDLAPSALVEVDVEVGHRRTFGVEEPLEDQVVLDRVEVGDPHRIRAHRAGSRATARPDPDPVVLGPVDEVGDDQEISRVPLFEDDLGLVASPLRRILRDTVGVAEAEPPFDLLDEPGLLVLPRRAGEPRHVAAFALDEVDLAALGDEQGVVAGLGELAEEVAHLLRRLEVELLRLELEPVRVHEGRARLDAQQRRVGLGVAGLGVVQVVGGDKREVEVLGQAQQLALGLPLDGDAVVHDLGEEVLLAEDVLELGRGAPGLGVLTQAQSGLDLPSDAAGGGDQPVGVAGEQLAVDARLEVVALHRGQRAHPEEVVHAVGGAGQQRHVRVCAAAPDVLAAGRVVAPADPGLVAPGGARGEIGLDADDGLDAVAAGLGPELVGAEDIAVVGRGDGRHPHRGRGPEQLVDARRTVQHRVLGVNVQVREAVVRGGHQRTHSR
jgi:hypothetical protein